MPMYTQTIRLWDIRNLEAHMQHVSNEGLKWLRVNYLNEDKRESLLAYLVAWAWKGSGLADDCRTPRPDITTYRKANNGAYPPATYDPRRGWSFSKWTYEFGRSRVVDWYRSPAEGFYDLRSPKPALPLSLDGPATNDTTDGSSRSLIEALADETCEGDLADQMGGDALIRWLRGDRDRLATQADPNLGREPDRRTPDAARAA